MSCTVESALRYNQAGHLRESIDCSIPPRPKVTPEMKEYIRRTDENAVAPRLIWSNLLRSPEIPEPALGYPSYAHVQRSVKHIRWLEGSKNSVQLVREFVRNKAFVADLDSNTAFAFGNREDADGFPYVGNGEDDEPLILGITTKTLLRRIMELQEQEKFLIFHMDATFKLHDLGYPVITCAFTDSHRVYQLAALFIVSQRREGDYFEAIRTFTRVYQNTMKSPIRIDAVMGDAESAQINALKKLAGFEYGKYLMGFFHVLSTCCTTSGNVYDTCQILSGDWFIVESWIRTMLEVEPILNRSGAAFTTLLVVTQPLTTRVRFSMQALKDIRFERRRLILKLLQIAEDASVTVVSSTASVRRVPTQESKTLAKALVTSERVAVFSTNENSVVRVCYIECLTDDEKASACAFFRKAVKWSVHRGHHIVMSLGGWVVRTNTFEYACPYYNKFLSCAHVICDRLAFGLSVPGVGVITRR
ncbi:hypothetical protein PHMEG_00014833 [Phytophthora megakarya]|uniref:MULE transposase domain-containing protein n=1 Tax=Phytophthora megakarya TaxID=4795 RepID=A0A225W3V7_9STRA|nr:hypothetical protein PHMEG_00014833 [Phytophthora megakarya]